MVDYRWPNKQMGISLIALLMGIILSLNYWLRVKSIGEVLIGCLMMIAMVIGIVWLIIWWSNKPE